MTIRFIIKGKGDNGTATITFQHPLTAVQFIKGTMQGNPVIKRISITGVAKSGSISMDEGGTLSAWSGVSDYAGEDVSAKEDETLEFMRTNSYDKVLVVPELYTGEDRPDVSARLAAFRRRGHAHSRPQILFFRHLRPIIPVFIPRVVSECFPVGASPHIRLHLILVEH